MVPRAFRCSLSALKYGLAPLEESSWKRIDIIVMQPPIHRVVNDCFPASAV